MEILLKLNFQVAVYVGLWKSKEPISYMGQNILWEISCSWPGRNKTENKSYLTYEFLTPYKQFMDVWAIIALSI